MQGAPIVKQALILTSARWRANDATQDGRGRREWIQGGASARAVLTPLTLQRLLCDRGLLEPLLRRDRERVFTSRRITSRHVTPSATRTRRPDCDLSLRVQSQRNVVNQQEISDFSDVSDRGEASWSPHQSSQRTHLQRPVFVLKFHCNSWHWLSTPLTYGFTLYHGVSFVCCSIRIMMTRYSLTDSLTHTVLTSFTHPVHSLRTQLTHSPRTHSVLTQYSPRTLCSAAGPALQRPGGPHLGRHDRLAALPPDQEHGRRDHRRRAGHQQEDRRRTRPLRAR